MRVLIVGAGDIGLQLGKRLSQDKHDITMVESDHKRAVRSEEGKIELVGVHLEADSPLARVPLIDLWPRLDYPPVTIAAIQRKQSTVIPRGRDVMVPATRFSPSAIRPTPPSSSPSPVSATPASTTS